MRSNNFFDQFNDELGNVITVAQIGIAIAGVIIVLAGGAASFWLLR
jgi:flagellar biosynthesis/type III secretory pathway M-ring protein FliF/YscJ